MTDYELRRLIYRGIEAMRLTREYVDPTGELLPALPGWSWFDWTQEAQAVLHEQPDMSGLDEAAS